MLTDSEMGYYGHVAEAEYTKRADVLVAVTVPSWYFLPWVTKLEWMKYMKSLAPKKAGNWDRPLIHRNMRCSTEPVPDDVLMAQQMVSHADEIVALKKRVAVLEDAHQMAVKIVNANFEESHRRVQAIYDRVSELEQQKSLGVEIEPTIEQSMNALLEEVTARKATEKNLRKVIEQLSQEVNHLKAKLTESDERLLKFNEALNNAMKVSEAECNKPTPYAISRADYEKATMNRTSQWYTSVVFFGGGCIVRLTDEQYKAVQSLVVMNKV